MVMHVPNLIQDWEMNRSKFSPSIGNIQITLVPSLDHYGTLNYSQGSQIWLQEIKKIKMLLQQKLGFKGFSVLYLRLGCSHINPINENWSYAQQILQSKSLPLDGFLYASQHMRGGILLKGWRLMLSFLSLSLSHE